MTSWQRRATDTALRLYRLERRIDPYVRPAFDAVFRRPLQAVVQTLINARRRDEPLGLAEERTQAGEAEAVAAIVEQMSRFLRREYPVPGTAQRAGNTKTYGVVRARLEVRADLPPQLRHGILRTARSYPAWVRFAGPGPLSPPDIDDFGILSIGVKIMDVDGPKLLDDERLTQDLTGISAPTFTTRDLLANADLQRRVHDGTSLFHYLGRSGHLGDLLMQVLYAKTHANPLATPYWSCVPYLLGEGQAMQYRFVPKDRRIGPKRPPLPPSDDYLREAMTATLSDREVAFDLLVQVQTDSWRMPVENAAVVWPDRLSRPVPVATLRLPVQRFDSPEQLAFADRLAINPWHCLPEHRPLGNQNRARREIYLQLSRLRQSMNDVPHIEPTGDEFLPAARSDPSEGRGEP
jgi:hypothetical protein